MDALLKPFYQFVTEPPRQWHPLLVHFPIVFLVLEAALLGLWRMTRAVEFERWAGRFLRWSLWSMLVVIVAGLHDTGLDLGAGNKIWLGLQDRWHNLLRFQSSVTVHSWLSLGLLVITTVRAFWRTVGGAAALRGGCGWGYAFLTLASLWVLTATGYVGGLISHK